MLRIACGYGDRPAQEATIGSKMSRFVYLGVGFVSLGLAILGAFLPVMPTTVFVLLAAWAFARSSPKLHAGLRSHKRFGPALRNWEDHGAIPRAGKVAAVTGMVTSMGGMLAAYFLMKPSGPSPLVLGLTALVLAASGAFVLTRPTRPPTETNQDSDV